MNPRGTEPPGRNVEAEILTKLLNYLGASGMLQTFASYKEQFKDVSPIIFQDNVAYVTEFREGYNVKQFLREQKASYEEPGIHLLIDQLIYHWKNAVSYLLMTIENQEETS